MNLRSKICLYTFVCGSPFEISKKANIVEQREYLACMILIMVATRSLCPPPAYGSRRIMKDTGYIHRRRLGSGLRGIQSAAASRVLLLLDDGGGWGHAGRHLINIRVARSRVTLSTSVADSFSTCMLRIRACKRWMV